MSPNREGESSSSIGRELLDLILTFNDESVDENESDDEDGNSREDFFSQDCVFTETCFAS